MFVWGLLQDDEDGMKIVRDEDWEKVITYCIDLLNEESVHGFDIIYCRISRDEKNKPTDK